MDCALGSISNPPPRPKEPGNWFLLRGLHWFSQDYGVNEYWATMTDDSIRSVVSSERIYEVGPINAQQLGLYMGVLHCPWGSCSLLQRQVYEFMNRLEPTHHPLAAWNCISHGIRKGVNSVWSPYDIIGYLFLWELRNLHSSVPANCDNELMLQIVNAILRHPGRYSRLVAEHYPNAATLPHDDPTDTTFLDLQHKFNPNQYTEIDVKAVLHYMWEVLRIPRPAAKFNLEPYVQLSTQIESAVGVWLDLVNPSARNAARISYRSSMTEPQAEAGLCFLGEEPVSFECGPVPLTDKASEAVQWRIPPPDIESLVVCIPLHKGWMPTQDRDAFEARRRFYQWASGYYEFL
jgi:hypothetical protein